MQRALLDALRYVGVVARAVGLRNYFGSAVPPGRKGLHPDVVLVGYHGLGRHHFIDVSITEPATPARTQGAGRAAVEAGWAANDRAAKKHNKYAPSCARIDCTFGDAVIERYGACSDGLVGLMRMVAGGGDSAPSDEGYSPAATSRVSGVAQMVVFGAVMADALMLEAVLEADFGGRERVV